MFHITAWFHIRLPSSRVQLCICICSGGRGKGDRAVLAHLAAAAAAAAAPVPQGPGHHLSVRDAQRRWGAADHLRSGPLSICVAPRNSKPTHQLVQTTQAGMLRGPSIGNMERASGLVPGATRADSSAPPPPPASPPPGLTSCRPPPAAVEAPVTATGSEGAGLSPALPAPATLAQTAARRQRPHVTTGAAGSIAAAGWSDLAIAERSVPARRKGALRSALARPTRHRHGRQQVRTMAREAGGHGKGSGLSRTGGGRSRKGGGRSWKGGGRSWKRRWKVKERAVEGQGKAVGSHGKGSGRSWKGRWTGSAEMRWRQELTDACSSGWSGRSDSELSTGQSR